MLKERKKKKQKERKKIDLGYMRVCIPPKGGMRTLSLTPSFGQFFVNMKTALKKCPACLVATWPIKGHSNQAGKHKNTEAGYAQ